jgi:S-adenosylmethionine decarboxylase proenzyme
MKQGQHLILDLDGCDPGILDDYDQLSVLLEKALCLAGANVLRIIGERFLPQGVTILALLSESHSSIHTWPELGYAAIDLYTCNVDSTNTQKAADFLIKELGATQVDKKALTRASAAKREMCVFS